MEISPVVKNYIIWCGQRGLEYLPEYNLKKIPVALISRDIPTEGLKELANNILRSLHSHGAATVFFDPDFENGSVYTFLKSFNGILLIMGYSLKKELMSYIEDKSIQVVLSCPSLRELQDDQTRKKEAWQILKPLSDLLK